MSIPNEDQRNRPGLAALRSRYIRRAASLLQSKTFIGEIDEERARWNEQYPEHRISAEIMPDDFPIDDRLIARRVLWPRSLARVRDEQIAWLQDRSSARYDVRETATADWPFRIESLCPRFWPPCYFPNPYQKVYHPASWFLSACLLYHTGTIQPESVERLFPHFSIGLESLPYPPDSPQVRLDHVRAVTERGVFHDRLRELLGDASDELKRIELEALHAGLEASHRQYPHGAVPSPDSGLWWWYIPVIPGMSASDVERASSQIAEHVAEVFGYTPINDQINELSDRGMSIKQIEELLGVTESTVKRARRARER